ncbi:MAG: helix-turn-helix transcriptional regulator [Bradyrhizobium sp.]|nr:helix-turn-helix transcriptional regulator [Bradyrhizobium sp.]
MGEPWGTDVAALRALSQETRLDIYRLLVQAGEEGLAAGKIGEELGLSSAPLAFHLKLNLNTAWRKEHCVQLVAATHVALSTTRTASRGWKFRLVRECSRAARRVRL